MRLHLFVAFVEFLLHNALHVVGIVVLLHLGKEGFLVLLAFFLRQVIEIVGEFLGELCQSRYLLVVIEFLILGNLQFGECWRMVKLGKGHDDDIDEEEQDEQVESVFDVFHARQFVDFLSDGDDISCQEDEEDAQEDGGNEEEVPFHGCGLLNEYIGELSPEPAESLKRGGLFLGDDGGEEGGILRLDFFQIDGLEAFDFLFEQFFQLVG